MEKIKIRMGLLLFLLIVVIVGFVYALYYVGEDEAKDGTLVEYRLPKTGDDSQEAML